MIVREFERHEALGGFLDLRGPVWVVFLQDLEDTLLNGTRRNEILVRACQCLLRASENQILGRAGEIHAAQVLTHPLEDMQAAHPQDFRVIFDLEVGKEVFGRVKLFEVGQYLAHAALLSFSTSCRQGRKACRPLDEDSTWSSFLASTSDVASRRKVKAGTDVLWRSE